jgi:hypothetical protein
MSNSWREALRQNHVDVIHALSDSNKTVLKQLLDRFYQAGILSWEVAREIEREKTPQDSSRRLLEHLSKRNETAYREFCRALDLNGLKHIVDALERSRLDAGK